MLVCHQINKVFRDLENKVNEKAEDPMKDTGNGKDSPIKQTQKWWDIRNWDHEVLERMTNSQWQGEAQIDDGGRTSPTNVKREPDFLKRLDEFASMEQKDDHLEYYKKEFDKIEAEKDEMEMAHKAFEDFLERIEQSGHGDYCE